MEHLAALVIRPTSGRGRLTRPALDRHPLDDRAMTTAKPVIVLDDLTLGYDRHPAIHHLSGQIVSGSLTAIIGPNGAGKSTLLKALAGILVPLGGKLKREPKHRLAYLPQLTEIDLSFPISAGDFVAMGLWTKIRSFGPMPDYGNHRVADALETVGLAGFANRLIGTLSGGQIQRVLFARMMLQDASIILIDEPFSAIDTATVDDLMKLILRWHHEGRTILTVLHDLRLVKTYFPESMLLAREIIAWGKTENILTDAHLNVARRRIEAPDPYPSLCEKAPK